MALVNIVMAWVSVVVWAGFIFYLSSIPSLNSGWGIWDLVARKMAHITEFGILTVLVARALRKTVQNWLVTRVLVFSAVAALLYAVSDEIHQSFVPGRGPSFGDVLIDGCGIMLAVLIYRLREKIEKP
jgi:VanZ family protein